MTLVRSDSFRDLGAQQERMSRLQKQFHRIARSHGPFARTFALAPTVDPGRVTAEYRRAC